MIHCGKRGRLYSFAVSTIPTRLSLRHDQYLFSHNLQIHVTPFLSQHPLHDVSVVHPVTNVKKKIGAIVFS